MSDQTPTSTDDLRGAEPSMEDILASIRKIISEDEPVALESPEDVLPVELVSLPSMGSEASDFVSDAISDVSDVASEGGSVDLNIDDVLASLDDENLVESELEIPEIPVDAIEDFSIEDLKPAANVPDLPHAEDVAAEATAFDDDDDVFDFLNSEEIVADETTDAAADLAATDLAVTDLDVAEAETLEASDDVEMDSLLEEILIGSEDVVEDPIEEIALDEVLQEDEYIDEPEVLSEAEQSDLDLVKSLMAELADDPSSYDSEGDLDALLDLEEPAEAALESSDAPILEEAEDLADLISADAEEEDILGDILDMTLEDELKGQPDELALEDLMTVDDVAAAEQENILENLLDGEANDLELAIDEPSIDELSSELPSLAEIAAAAEADAIAVETSAAAPIAAATGLAAAGAGLAALGAKVTAQPDETTEVAETEIAEIETPVIETAEIEGSTVDIPTEIQAQSLSTQETSMPVKAVKTDAIIDEVTETAAVGAFAELNQVVEDKAVFNESGPRIGDLVQEALRPMLKEWLDANLKGIVERAVTKEVKRISKGQ